MCAAFKRLIAFSIFGLFALVGLAQAQAATFYYQTYLDLDGNPVTGCTVTVPDNLGVNQTLNGVDVSLLLTVTNGALASAERFACVGGALVSQGPEAGHPTYTLTGAFIEYQIPNVAITQQTTVGFAASTSPNFNVPSDVMFESNGQPISLAPLLRTLNDTPIPVSTPILLLLIALAAGLIAARYLRTHLGTPHSRRLGAIALIFCLTSISGSVWSVARIILDGSGHSWSGVPVLATDPEGDAPRPEIDLLNAYSFYQGDTLYFKLDLKQKPGSDTTPLQPASDFRLLSATVTEPDAQSKVTASGTANQIRGTAAKVRIKNTRTSEIVTVSVTAALTNNLSNNTWQGTLTAKPKDVLELTPIAANNNEGGAIRLTVQGTAQEPTLPPDPINGGIAPQLDPLAPYTVYDSTRFLYTNNPPVQTGVDPDTIKPKFASLLVGKTLDRNDQPLSGVTVKVKDHNQYGQTLTREDGQWDLVVNGGQWFTVEYSKDGYLTLQRKVQVAWQDYGYLPDVVLIPLDPKVSVIDLRDTDANAPAFQIHQGTISSDVDGNRQATVLFPKGVTAQMQMPDGRTRDISVLNVRATEYTIGQNGPNAMPGELPPATGYTYAVELSVDQAMETGAAHVNFSQPLPMYVDNFLNFPVGEIVPLGWYDYDLKAWVPDENGYVLKVLSINNGAAVLDVKGNGIAATQAELDKLGITNDELKAIAQLYQTGKTFWRVRVTHFTPFDCNTSLGSPPCGEGESCEPPKTSTPQPRPRGCSSTQSGCTIQAQNRTMSETLPLTGTPFSLEYSTARVPGYMEGLLISQRGLRDDRPLQGDIYQIWSKAQVLGREIPIFSAAASNVTPSQTVEFRWDGKDRYGRTLYRTTAKVNHVLGYETIAVYYAAPGEGERSFGQYSSTTQMIGDAGNRKLTLYNTVEKNMIAPAQSASVAVLEDDLGLWTLNLHHHYDPVTRVLEKGTGERRVQTSADIQVDNIVGSYWYDSNNN
ncbi:MAG: hypothetical protein FWC42_08325 [Proteobacteria bacterium]|nr:hypothetical protein [Pseudomonadota bacterium]